MRILILGCGYIGSALGEQLVHQGHEVIGVVRSIESAQPLKPLGIISQVADCSCAEGAHVACKGGADVVILSISSRGGDYQRTYVDSMHHVLAALKEHPPQLFFYTSSTSVYAQTDGEWVTETSPTKPPHQNGKLLLKTEQLLVQSGFPAWILRLSGIYGPGRHAMLDKLREGVKTLPGNGHFWVNQIHRDDIVGTILHLIRLGTLPSTCDILNVTDDTPVLQCDYVEWICQKLGRSVPCYEVGLEPGGKRGHKSFQSNRRISNRALRELGWAPYYPSYREGLISHSGGLTSTG